MIDAQRLAKLLQAEASLKNTKVGYTPNGPNWRAGMSKLWLVRTDLGDTSLGKALAQAHEILKQTEKGYEPHAPRWAKAMQIIDSVEVALARQPVPNLGPCCAGDKAVLLHSPTHDTSGIKRPGQPSAYPAFDTGWVAGKRVLAPERLKVTRQSSAAGADAFYAEGVSTIGYWFGHIAQAPPTGMWFDRGDAVGVIANIATRYGGPHLHLGLNTISLIGHDLKYGRDGDGPDYTFGSPAIGVQLAQALSS